MTIRRVQPSPDPTDRAVGVALAVADRLGPARVVDLFEVLAAAPAAVLESFGALDADEAALAALALAVAGDGWASIAAAQTQADTSALNQIARWPHDLPGAVDAAAELGLADVLGSGVAGGTVRPWTSTLLDPTWAGRARSDVTRAAVQVWRGQDVVGWPGVRRLVPHGLRKETPVAGPLQNDQRVWAGNLAGLPAALADGCDAVVSLCRVGTDDVPAGVAHVEPWLIDITTSPNAAAVIDDAAQAVTLLIDQGRRPYVHCFGGRSRSAAVVIRHLQRTGGPADAAEALALVKRTLPGAHIATFGSVLNELVSRDHGRPRAS